MSRTSAWPLLLASLGLLVLAVMLLSAPSPAVLSGPSAFGGGEILRGTVLEEVERGTSALNRPFVRLRVRADSGSIAGATLDVEELPIGPTNVIREFKAGDRVLLSYTRNPNGTDNAYIVEYVRTTQLFWLAGLFAVAIGLVGGFQGLRSLLGMAISFLVILRFMIPHILNGESPVLISVVGALAILVATLYLSHGLNAKTTAALAGTVIALLITGILGEVFIAGTRLTGLSSEEVTYLSNQTGPLSFRGLLLAGLIIGTLGVLDDVAASQSSAVFELHAANPALSLGELFRRGMRVGRDHIASTVNTLFLAYAGSALPLLLLLSTRPEPIGTLLNRESITVEFVSALTGSIGLISAVPLTTLVAAAAVSRRSRWRTPDPLKAGSAEPTGTPPPEIRRDGDSASTKMADAESAPPATVRRIPPRREGGATMTTAPRCAHCDSPIVDPTSQVIHGRNTYCCTNCAHAMEESGSGSDPHAGRHENDLRCAHCGCAIVDETTLETRGEDAYCCQNCALAMEPAEA